MAALADKDRSSRPRVVNKIYRVFFSPPEYEPAAADHEVVTRGRSRNISSRNEDLAVSSWGQDGPAVLLMHGWGGARAKMAGFVDPLLGAGYRVVAFDQPAHGDSGGRQTTLPRFQSIAGLPDGIISGLREKIYQEFGRERIEGVVNSVLAPRINIPALMFHDRNDDITPFEDSRAIADAWPAATLVEVEGLGHQGALLDKGVHEQVTNFLKD